MTNYSAVDEGKDNNAQRFINVLIEQSTKPLFKKDYQAIGQAMGALVKIGSNVVETIIRLLRETNNINLRLNLIYILGKIGDTRASEVLSEIAQTTKKYDPVVKAAKDALKNLSIEEVRRQTAAQQEAAQRETLQREAAKREAAQKVRRQVNVPLDVAPSLEPRCSVCNRTNDEYLHDLRRKDPNVRIIIPKFIGVCPVCNKGYCVEHAAYDGNIDHEVCPTHRESLM